MSIIIQNNSERFFSQLCSHYYLRGFVFHSPRIDAPTEIELGDVLIWLRTKTINFELIWRDPLAPPKLTSFIKSIGKKRDQLKRDYQLFSSLTEPIKLRNEYGRYLYLRPDDFKPKNYFGVVLIDSQDNDIKLHYSTLKKSIELPFVCNFISFQGLESILNELDTISDLGYYLHDRAEFSKHLLAHYPNTALMV